MSIAWSGSQAESGLLHEPEVPDTEISRLLRRLAREWHDLSIEEQRRVWDLVVTGWFAEEMRAEEQAHAREAMKRYKECRAERDTASVGDVNVAKV